MLSRASARVHVFRITNFFHINQTKLTIQACNDSTKFQCYANTETCIKTLKIHTIITKRFHTFSGYLRFSCNTACEIRTCIHY